MVLDKLNSLIFKSPDEKEYLRTDVDKSVEVDTFQEMFGDVEEDYNSLINHPKAQDNRWQTIFEDWKEKGVLQ